MNIESIARICHEANRALCSACGDDSQVPWDEAPAWQRDSSINGVKAATENPSNTPEAQHEAWSRDKFAAGWVYGPVKDADRKTHPCLVPYRELPHEQKLKDVLFMAIVAALGGGQ